MLRALVTLILAGLPAVAAAQAPYIYSNSNLPGEYGYRFETPTVLDYSYDGQKIPGTTLMLVQGLNGTFTGHSETTGITIHSTAKIRGKVKAKDGLPFVQMTTADVGEIDGDPTSAVGKLQASLQGWGPDCTLVGELRLKLCMTLDDPNGKKKRICLPGRHPFEEKVAHAGTWEVRMSMDRSGNTFLGYGTIVTNAKTANIRFFEAELHGKYSPKTGLSTVKVVPLSATGLGSVTLIGVTAEDADHWQFFDVVHEVRGKLLGQAFDEQFVFDGAS